jgi:Xaa-Pro aminopeptidase
MAGHGVDAAARQVIADAGYAEFFVHRTGHSIGVEVHGNGANVDGYETRDTRRLLPHTCFSIEPGIYLPALRRAQRIDVYLSDGDAVITGLPVQTSVVPILAAGEIR